MSPRPPRLVRALLLRVAAFEDRDFILADLDARYRAIALEAGEARARRWYRSQVLRAIPALMADRARDLRQAGLRV